MATELKERLAQLLADEALESIEDVRAAMQSKSAELSNLEEKGKGATRPANNLREDLGRLQAILDLEREIAALEAEALAASNPEETPERKEMREQLNVLLQDMGQEIEEVPEALATAEAKLKTLLAKGAQPTAKSVVNTQDEIATLRKILDLQAMISAPSTLSAAPIAPQNASVTDMSPTIISSPCVDTTLTNEKRNTIDAPQTEIPAEPDIVRDVVRIVEQDTSSAASQADEPLPSEPMSCPTLSEPTLSPSPIPPSPIPPSPLPPSGCVAMTDEQMQEWRDGIHAVSNLLPDCAERTAQILLRHFQLLQKAATSSTTKVSDEVLCELFEKFLRQLEVEEIDIRVPTSQEFRGLLEKRLLSEISANLVKIVRDMQPLDLQLMIRLIQDTEKAATLIKDKDVILLLGGTGAGKSTTIHFLAGSKMEETKLNGISHIAPVEIKNPALATFTSAPWARSETRSINAVEVDYKSVGARMKGSVLLCDSPGFGDTEGAEIDIANGAGIVKAVRGCRSVKPLIISSNKSIGDRFEGVSKLAATLARFITNIEDKVSSFSYIFTKFSAKDLEEINARLQNKIDGLNEQERANTALIVILNDMLDKTRAYAMGVDPINDRPAQLLEYLSTTPAIRNPREVFHNFVTPDSFATLNVQLHKDSAAITKAMNRGDISLLAFKLGQLKSLADDLNILQIRQIYDECRQTVCDYLLGLIGTCFEGLELCFADGNTVVQDNIEVFCGKIVRLVQFEAVRETHLSDRDIPHLSEQVATFFSEALRRILTVLKASPSVLRDPHTKERLDKMQMVLKTLGALFAEKSIEIPDQILLLSSIYTEGRAFVNEAVSTCLQQARAEASKGMYESFVKSLSDLSYAFLSFGDHLDMSKHNSSFLEIKTLPFRRLQESVSQHVEMMNSGAFSAECVPTLKCLFAEVNLLFGVVGVWQHLNEEDFADLLNQLKTASVALFEAAQRSVQMIIEKMDLAEFPRVSSAVILLRSMREVPDIALATQDLYQETTNLVRTYVHDTKLLVTTQLQQESGDLTGLRHKVDSLVALLDLPVEVIDVSIILDDLKAAADRILGSILSVLADATVGAETFSNLPKLLSLYKRLTAVALEMEPLCPEMHTLASKGAVAFLERVKACMGDCVTRIGEAFDEKAVVAVQVLRSALGLGGVALASQIEELVESGSNLCSRVENYLQSFFRWWDETANQVYNSLATRVASDEAGDIIFDGFVALPRQSSDHGSVESSSVHSNVYRLSRCLATLQELEHAFKSEHDEVLLAHDSKAATIFASLFKTASMERLSSWCEDDGRLASLLSLFREYLTSTDVNVLKSCMVVCKVAAVLDKFLRLSDATAEVGGFGALSAKFDGALKEYNLNLENRISLALAVLDFEEVRKLAIELMKEKSQDACKQLSEGFFAKIDAELSVLNEDLGKLGTIRFSHEATGKAIERWANLVSGTEILRMLDEEKTAELQSKIEEVDTTLSLKLDDIANQGKACASSFYLTQAHGTMAFLKQIIPTVPSARVRDTLTAQLQDLESSLQNNFDNMKTMYESPCAILSLQRLPEALEDIPTADAAFVIFQSKFEDACVDEKDNVFNFPTASSCGTTFAKAVDGSEAGLQVAYMKKSLNLLVSSDIKDATLAKACENACAGDGSAQPIPSDLLANLEAACEFSHINLNFAMVTKIPPIDLLKEIDHACEYAPEVYTTIKATITQSIIQGLTTHLKQVHFLPTEQAYAQLREIQTSFKYLPLDSIVSVVDPVVREAETALMESEAVAKRELEEKLILQNTKELIDLLISYAKVRRYSSALTVKREIDVLVLTSVNRFKSDLEKKDVIAVLENIPSIYGEWAFYHVLIRDVKKLSPWCEKQFRDAISKSCVAVIQCLVQQTVGILAMHERCDELSAEALENLSNVALLVYKTSEKQPDFFDFMMHEHPSLRDLIETALTSVVNVFASRSGGLVQKLAHNAFHDIEDDLMFSKLTDPVRAKVREFLTNLSPSHTFAALRPKIEACLSFTEVQQKLTTSIEDLKVGLKVILFANPKLSTPNATDRDDFFTAASLSLQPLRYVHSILTKLGVSADDSTAVETEILTHWRNEVGKVGSEIKSILKVIPSQDKTPYEQFNILFDCLRSCAECFKEPSVAQVAKSCMDEVERDFVIKLEDLRKLAQTEPDIEAKADAFVAIKAITLSIPCFKAKIDKMIDSVLNYFTTQRSGADTIGKLCLKLNERTTNGIGPMLIAEHTAFDGFSRFIRNEKTLRFTIDDVLRALSGDDVNAAVLLDLYKLFNDEYWSIVEASLASEVEKSHELTKIAANARKIADCSEDSQIKVRRLMAHLFAHWTVSHAEHYKQALKHTTEKLENKKNYLLQPHAAQVVSIFRLFGLDSKGIVAKTSVFDKIKSCFGITTVKGDIGSTMCNHLVQIGTGEGKSVTLAIASTVLALLGFDVNCACYSEYLSKRDYQAFTSIFEGFGVAENIKYGTFNHLCEDYINDQGNIRERVATLIKTGSLPSLESARKGTKTRPKVLLIDEVDVFFNKDFYGNVYRPLASLQGGVFRNLIDYVWRNRASDPTLEDVKASTEFQACCAQCPGWEGLFEEGAKAMLHDLKTFESQEYTVIGGRIGYKDQDGISFELTYGYKTLFAYLKEFEAGKVTQSALDKKVALFVNCGSFSYAEIPKQYVCVMGVTGTLKTLSATQFQILENEYDIKKRTYMPSVYGSNQLEFPGNTTRGVRIEGKSSYYAAIREVINEYEKRAVLVFFESTPQLKAFQNSPVMADLIKFVKIMTEATGFVEKEGLVRQAATIGNITLLSREFGRGTDFVCYDDELNSRGGVHVIQTFVSEELSEETQIKGRTARQGNKGSYSMVLLEDDLEKFNIGLSDIADMKSRSSLYDTINAKRIEMFDKLYPESLRKVNDIKEEHDEAMAFVAELAKGNIPPVREFILKRNRILATGGGGGGSNSRTIVLMDATGSMTNLLNKAKNTVSHMFERAHEILQEKGFSASFELQFAVYRNYNCDKDYLLQYSAWESDPANLKTFMDTIDVAGGLGNEAIEIGLWHVNRELEENTITQVVLIGDMPPNTEVEVSERRKSNRGESYWGATQFREKTHYLRELQFIKEKNVKVHSFFVHTAAEEKFREIAEMTGGRCEELDINSPEGAEMLTALITEEILRSIGGDSLAAAYAAKFGYGYTT